MSIIQKALIANAIKNFKMAAVGGGEGRFAMKGAKFMFNKFQIQFDEIELAYNFKVGKVDVEDAEIAASYDYAVKFKVVNLRAANHLEEVIEIEELELAGLADIENFFMSLPLAELMAAN